MQLLMTQSLRRANLVTTARLKSLGNSLPCNGSGKLELLLVVCFPANGPRSTMTNARQKCATAFRTHKRSWRRCVRSFQIAGLASRTPLSTNYLGRPLADGLAAFQVKNTEPNNAIIGTVNDSQRAPDSGGGGGGGPVDWRYLRRHSATPASAAAGGNWLGQTPFNIPPPQLAGRPAPACRQRTEHGAKNCISGCEHKYPADWNGMVMGLPTHNWRQTWVRHNAGRGVAVTPSRPSASRWRLKCRAP